MNRGMRGFLTIGLLAALCLRAQSPKAFEVASIRPNAENDNRIRIGQLPGGRYEATGVTLRNLLQNAYKVQDFQISGGPGWLSTDRFDIQAKAAGGETVSGPDIKLMLQSLLADRFKVKLRRETREEPAFALVPAKNGPKLKAVPDSGNGMIRAGRGSMSGPDMTLKQLSEMLGNQVNRVVLDRTGIAGNFDIALKWTPDTGEGSADNLGPTLYTALQEQLGLRLDSIKAPVEVLVIESAEKPSEN